MSAAPAPTPAPAPAAAPPDPSPTPAPSGIAGWLRPQLPRLIIAAVVGAGLWFWLSAPSVPPPAPRASVPTKVPTPPVVAGAKESPERQYQRPVQRAADYAERPQATPPPAQVVAQPPPPTPAPEQRLPWTMNVVEASGAKPRQRGDNPEPPPPAPDPAGANRATPASNPRPPARRLSEEFLPTGTLIRCETIMAVSSDSSENPIIGRTTNDVVSPTGVKIIPKGTMVHGTATSLSAVKTVAKLRTGTRWTLVFPKAHRDVAAGAELTVKALALHRGDNETIRNSWSMTDGDAGLRGYVLDDPSRERVLAFLTAVASATASGLQTTTTSVGAFGTTSAVEATPRNAALGGLSAGLALEVENLQKRVRESGAFLLVPGGTGFYLYLNSPIDLADARVGDSTAFVRPVSSDFDEQPGQPPPAPAGQAEQPPVQRTPVPVPAPFGRGSYQQTQPAPPQFYNPGSR